MPLLNMPTRSLQDCKTMSHGYEFVIMVYCMATLVDISPLFCLVPVATSMATKMHDVACGRLYGSCCYNLVTI